MKGPLHFAPPAMSSPAERPLLALVGPTAVGKTAFALELCEELGLAIASLDSMQVYRRMDVGTAKPTPAERARVPHHLIDLVEPAERYDARRYLSDAEALRARLAGEGKTALFVGGAGLYLKALASGLFGGPPVDLVLRARLQERARELGRAALHAELAGRDPAAAARIHPNDEKRVVRALEVLEQTGRPLSDWQREWGWHGPAGEARPMCVLGLALAPGALEPRIRRRIRAMLEGGWVQEASAIRAAGGFGPTAIQALGYREVLAHADGELGAAELEERLVQLTRRFVRRQSTWFRSFPGIHWLDPGSSDARAEARRRLGVSGS